MSKPAMITRGEIRHNLDAFVVRWHEKIAGWDQKQRGRSEISNAQMFWADLLRQFGIIPERINLFERDAQRASTGRNGSIDVFWSGTFLGEAKSIVDEDLDGAYEQALDYLRGGSVQQHEWPRYVMVTNFGTFRIVKQGEDVWTAEFPLEKLPNHVDQLMFLAGQETITKREEAVASRTAVELIGRLYTAMVGEESDEAIGEEAPRSPEEEDTQVLHASMFLTRVLFLLYGDDAGLWEQDLFYRLVLSDTTADTLGPQLSALFRVLDTPEKKRRRVPESMAKFPYVNGSLFADPLDPGFFTPPMRDALLAACRFNWSTISPAIFGSMFQTVKSKEARRAAGEHYTTETNIHKVLGPLFLDRLRSEADRLIRNKGTTQKELRAFRDSLATIQMLDPACGSGNFLTLAYQGLRDIETDIITHLRRLEGTEGEASLDVTLESKVTIDQVHGFEIGWWPAKIAETAMFLADHQANRKLALAVGDAPRRLPLTVTAHIHHGDSLWMDWSDLVRPRYSSGFLTSPNPGKGSPGPTYVFGNPPFVGHKKKKEVADDLRHAWGNRPSSALDYVTGWHAKTLNFFEDRPGGGEWGFVTTSSIVAGQQTAALFEAVFDAGWKIKFAHQQFLWKSEAPKAAVVHCVIVGFTRDQAARQRLWAYPKVKGDPIPVELRRGINAYLIDGPDVLVRPRSNPLSPQLPPVHYGSMPVDNGNLLLSKDAYKVAMADPIAAKYVRPFIGADELLNGTSRWCLWLVNAPASDITGSPFIKARVEACRTWRSEQSRTGDAYKYRDLPHLFRPNKTVPTAPYLAIPCHVSENRRYFTVARYDADVICGNANFQAPDADGLMFALLSSSMFMCWQRSIGGKIKSDLRFGKSTSWNTFPLPNLDEKTRAAIIDGGRKVLAAREAIRAERGPQSLSDLYEPLAMDPRLLKAHDALDRIVDRVFGEPRKLSSDSKRLEILIDAYVERGAEQ
ncbi:class I SAM-dependent DNA methyltransferase [Rhodococcus sp. 14C212]|uniref:class I SAM-dependent DNA methyltransferase n=1 Tax=Rhodococcus sp. 14C212 TaxID=2711209 RepID=UPI0013ECD8AB|nr:class I SAM-dependent DNA methyltransferase [Rhodococcus sp. 14C212]NGP05772.1 class I SAM-dependent DNA methyltransferase [Rhodococcus sp. 14C212]